MSDMSDTWSSEVAHRCAIDVVVRPAGTGTWSVDLFDRLQEWVLAGPVLERAQALRAAHALGGVRAVEALLDAP